MKNILHIYSNKWFSVAEWGFVQEAPCWQLLNYWNFRTLQNAISKLKELWKDYQVIDHRGSYWLKEDIEADKYSD